MCRNQLQLRRLPTSNIDTLFCVVSAVCDESFSRLRQAASGWLTPGAPLAPWLRYGASRRRRLELPVEDIQQQSNPRFCPVHVNVKHANTLLILSARQLALADTLLCSDSQGNQAAPLAVSQDSSPANVSY